MCLIPGGWHQDWSNEKEPSSPTHPRRFSLPLRTSVLPRYSRPPASLLTKCTNEMSPPTAGWVDWCATTFLSLIFYLNFLSPHFNFLVLSSFYTFRSSGAQRNNAEVMDSTLLERNKKRRHNLLNNRKTKATAAQNTTPEISWWHLQSLINTGLRQENSRISSSRGIKRRLCVAYVVHKTEKGELSSKLPRTFNLIQLTVGKQTTWMIS